MISFSNKAQYKTFGIKFFVNLHCDQARNQVGGFRAQAPPVAEKKEEKRKKKGERKKKERKRKRKGRKKRGKWRKNSLKNRENIIKFYKIREFHINIFQKFSQQEIWRNSLKINSNL